MYTDLPHHRITPRTTALWLCAAIVLGTCGTHPPPVHAQDPEGNPRRHTPTVQHGPFIRSGTAQAAPTAAPLPVATGAITATGTAATNRAPALELLPPSVIRHPLCLAGGEGWPYFALCDLLRYAPPLSKPHSWTTPPLRARYPELLRNWPSAARDYPPETVTYLAQHEVRQGDRRSPYVALTFDCENGTESTRQILKSLRDQNARASFFVLGRYAYEWPEIIREIDDGGHELASHSFFHPLFTALPTITATSEITYTEAAVARAVGRPVALRYIRFPYGGRNDAVRLHASSMGYQSAFWNLDPRGWEPDKAAEDVVAYMRKHVHPGGIVIMHCSCWDDAQALPGVIQAIRKRGLIPGTLSDVLTPEDRNIPGYP